ncbi:hypothetical protein FRC01_003568 [Tulasnella sp. 417]|nr:hypothetical protein FRC01_003568 [Tulasnella sp. 417]
MLGCFVGDESQRRFQVKLPSSTVAFFRSEIHGMHPTSGIPSPARLSKQQRAQLEQSIDQLLQSEISKDDSSRELSADDPRRQLEMFDKLSWVLNACRNRVVPINQLPQEILYHIFSAVLQLEDIHGFQPGVTQAIRSGSSINGAGFSSSQGYGIRLSLQRQSFGALLTPQRDTKKCYSRE